MLKKIVSIALVLCLVWGISVMAENVNDGNVPEMKQGMPQGRPAGMPQGGMQGRVTPPDMPEGEMPNGEFTPPQNAGEFTPSRETKVSAGENVTQTTQTKEVNQENTANTEETPQEQNNNPFGGQMPEGVDGFRNMQNGQTAQEEPLTFWGFVKTYSTPITSVVLLGLAFIFVIFYRRKNY